MEKQTMVLEQDKVTKNTVRYASNPSGQPPAVKTVYVQKWALGEEPPEKIELSVEDAE